MGPGKTWRGANEKGKGEGYLTTKLSCLMSVADVAWVVLKESRKSTAQREKDEGVMKGEIRADTLEEETEDEANVTRLRIYRERRLRRRE